MMVNPKLLRKNPKSLRKPKRIHRYGVKFPKDIPILVNQNFIIVDGHSRVQAAIDLGITQVKTLILFQGSWKFEFKIKDIDLRLSFICVSKTLDYARDLAELMLLENGISSKLEDIVCVTRINCERATLSWQSENFYNLPIH